ncbi:hypothetical protein IWQ62_002500 [Dispira parvispora]|uniref:BAH domain-containing protein n=1 Tax=Dispira parvispora TaxID=1520584 RepID=A0A9W8E742_9FUNG|nr:hypothetical protein IWQ62_002500 [Dispira parvispora]
MAKQAGSPLASPSGRPTRSRQRTHSQVDSHASESANAQNTDSPPMRTRTRRGHPTTPTRDATPPPTKRAGRGRPPGSGKKTHMDAKVAKETVYLDKVTVNGRTVGIGDFIHAVNDADETVPHVAQINDIRMGPENEPELDVCWYVHPMQTVHVPSRTFYENEVFRTQGVNHPLPLSQALDQCYVLPLANYTRGRPADMAPGAKVYVCEHRYTEVGHTFKRIKDWKSTLPVKVRHTKVYPGDEPDNWTPFAEPLVLKRVASVFKEASKSPSKTSSQPRDKSSDEEGNDNEEEDDEGNEMETEQSGNDEAEGSHSETESPNGRVTRHKLRQQPTEQNGMVTPRSQQKRSADAMDTSPSGTEGPTTQRRGHVQAQELPQDTGTFAEANVPQMDPTLVKRLHHDARGRVLWYAAPPLFVPHSSVSRPMHSLQYLAYRSRQMSK